MLFIIYLCSGLLVLQRVVLLTECIKFYVYGYFSKLTIRMVNLLLHKLIMIIRQISRLNTDPDFLFDKIGSSTITKFFISVCLGLRVGLR